MFVTFLSGVLGSVLVTSARKSLRDSVQDAVLFKLMVSKARVQSHRYRIPVPKMEPHRSKFADHDFCWG